MRPVSAALLAFLLGLLTVPAAAWLYLRFGHPPVAVADQPFPMEQTLAMHAVHRRTTADAPGSAPIPSSPETLLAGAHIYTQNCAMCHGTPGQPSPMHTMEFPHPPGLWVKHQGGVVGVSDDPAGQTFWVVENGIRLTGMPSYKNHLSDTEMWQVSLLLAVADKPLPDAVQQALTSPLAP